MKTTVYLDSTIFSYLFDERASIQTYIEVTKRWWARERHHYTLRISEEVIAELSEGDYPRKSLILPVVSEVPVLPSDPRILDIAKVYLENYLMPQEYTGDAIHLAYASLYKMDFLLTWNWNHLANANKYQHIRIINSQMLLPTPEITTPLTLFTEENHVTEPSINYERTGTTTPG